MAHILIVEDNPDIVRLYRYMFPEHQLSTFMDVPESIEFLSTTLPDLTLLDMHLPSGFGLEVLKHINTHDPLHPSHIICISADDSFKEAALAEGVHAFVTKPFEVAKLSSLACQLLVVKQLQEETLPHRPHLDAQPITADVPPLIPTIQQDNLRGKLARLINRIKNL